MVSFETALDCERVVTIGIEEREEEMLCCRCIIRTGTREDVSSNLMSLVPD